MPLPPSILRVPPQIWHRPCGTEGKRGNAAPVQRRELPLPVVGCSRLAADSDYRATVNRGNHDDQFRHLQQRHLRGHGSAGRGASGCPGKPSFRRPGRSLAPRPNRSGQIHGGRLLRPKPVDADTLDRARSARAACARRARIPTVSEKSGSGVPQPLARRAQSGDTVPRAQRTHRAVRRCRYDWGLSAAAKVRCAQTDLRRGA